MIIAGAALAMCIATAAPRPGDPPPDPIVLGMSSALSGPAADLGLGVKAGVEAAIAEINAAGGVQGRPLVLRALDDGYEPARAGLNMKQLVDDPNMLAVIGNVGTPTAVVAVPIAREAKVAFFGAYTGAGLLRMDPPERYVINVRASYAQETAAMVDALVRLGGLNPSEIGFFTQRDAFGDAGYAGGLAALKANGLSEDALVAHGRYERNTVDVDNALAELLTAPTQVKAVIMVATYAPAAAFIKAAAAAGFSPRFLNVSFVGSQPLIEALGERAEGVIITQVVPSPSSRLPLAAEFTSSMKQHQPSAAAGFGAFEGYTAMRVLSRALASATRPLTRESVVDAIDGLGTFDLGLGEHLSLSRTDHQALDGVWPTVVREGEVVAADWSILAGGLTADAQTGAR